MEAVAKIKNYTNEFYDIYFLQELGLTYKPLKAWLRNQLKGRYFYRVRFSDFSPITYVHRQLIEIAKSNNDFYIVFDQSLEAYAYKNFHFVNTFVKENKLENRVIFLSAHSEAEKEYEFWKKHNSEIHRFQVKTYNSWLTSTRRYFVDTHLDFSVEKTKWFCCLNHRPHHHRVSTLVYLDYLNLIEKGIVTGHDRNYEQRLENLDKYNYFENYINAATKKFRSEYADIIQLQHHKTKEKLPLVYDLEDIGNSCQPFKVTESIFNETLINLVTETFYFNHWNYNSEIFITEKTIKSILSKQIFIVVGPRGFLKKLRSMGIRTFSDVIDESYDDEPDSTRLFKAIESMNKAMNRYSLQELNDLTKSTRLKNYKTYMKLDFNINVEDILRE